MALLGRNDIFYAKSQYCIDLTPREENKKESCCYQSVHLKSINLRITPSVSKLRHQPKKIVLRAETEEDMHEWLNTIIKHKLLADTSVRKSVEVEKVGDSYQQLKPSFKLIQEDTPNNNLQQL